jgi:N,N'-diacetyllegionaminate synthase
VNPWDSRVFVIAEVGVNHNGEESLAVKLIDEAVAAGADAVKLQAFRADELVTAGAPLADYQKAAAAGAQSQRSMLKALELSPEIFVRLAAHASKRGIVFFATAFDFESITMLRSMEIPIWKIPSGEITNLPYLRRVGGCGRPIILSTGMANLAEIEAALTVLEAAGADRKSICILHCTTEYPAPWQEVNLRAMLTLSTAFGTGAVGYSDHTIGLTMPIAAVALGARVLEKHFTLDRNMSGPDHKASLEPRELAEMVTAIRRVEMALGDGIKRPTRSELRNMLIARRSIVAKTTIKCGDVYCEGNLAAKRPGGGISPMLWDRLLGRRAVRDFQPDEPIEW